ncbi:MAG TPA: YaaR family protein [Bacillales bacterium]
MKITQELRSKHEAPRPAGHSSARESSRFSGLVKEGQARVQMEGLDLLYADIEKQADRVIRSRTIADFIRFKQQVQQFMEEAVGSGLELRKSREWPRGGGNRKLATVQKIDEKLVEMTEQFLDQKQPAVNLLAQIGEIQGLLINLYR